MRVDAHQHFWRYDPQRHKWIDDNMSVLKRDFLPDEFVRELGVNQMDASIAVQVDQSEAETLFLLELADANPSIAGVVGWVDLRSSAVTERLQYFSQFEKLRGFRHIVQAEPDDFLARPDFVSGLAALEPFGYTYDVLVYPRQLPAAIRLAAKLPQHTFVLDHIAKPEIKSGLLHPWRKQICELAAHPNVFCKLSGLVTEAHWQNWTPEDFKPYLDVVFENFGPERLMFGSDWPVCLLAADYGQVKRLIADYVHRNAPDHENAIFGENAMRCYGLKATRWTCS